MRFTVAAVLLRLIIAVLGSRPGVRSWHHRSWFTVAGLLNGLGYALVYLGEETVPGAFASILFGTLPLLTAFLAAITKTERVTMGHVLGAITALAGIVIIFGDRASVSTDQGAGVALLCGGVVVSAFYSLVLKRESSGVHALCATSWFLVVTSIALWVAALIVEGAAVPWPPPLSPTLALLYLAIFGSVLTFASYLYLLQHVSLMTTTTLVFIQPVIALFVDSQWESDIHLTSSSYLGAGITLCGVMVATLWKRTGSLKA